MFNFDSLTLTAFLIENTDFFCNARIQKIQQPTRRDFIFTLRNSGKTQKFYININPNMYHICFLTDIGEKKRFLKIPQKPPMFCMLLRKYLECAKITRVFQPPYERILEIYIETYNELKEKIELCLAIELMGKHSNVILYNTDSGIILGCAHNVGAEKSREREIIGGVPYAYPTKNGLIKNISDFKTFSSEILLNKNNVNDTIDEYYSAFQSMDKIKALKTSLKTNISHKLKKTKNTIEKMQKQILQSQNGEKYRLYGDLIMSNLYRLKDFSSFAELIDFDGKNITIELNKRKSLKDNAQNFYKMYKKLKMTKEKLSEFLAQNEVEKDYLEQILYTIDSTDEMEILLEIKAEIQPQINNKKENKNTVLDNIKKETYEIYIGKNNKQNDYIVSKLSRSEDFWFHIKNAPGSHVLLKTQNNTEPSDELILQCAQLAKKHSFGKESLKVSIIYTKRKFLKKPPASPLGYVTYSNEKEIMV